MELTTDLDGTLYLFAGGTGILPFLDLIDFVLKKAIFKIAKRNSYDIRNFFEEDYENSFHPTFKIILYGAFSTIEDFTGYDFITKLYNISKEENLSLFEAIVRVDKGEAEIKDIPKTKSYFNEEFIKNHVDFQSKSRFYVCGSPAMNKTILGALANLRVPEGRIYIV
jgi:ferredoxin-NADP reductase